LIVPQNRSATVGVTVSDTGNGFGIVTASIYDEEIFRRATITVFCEKRIRAKLVILLDCKAHSFDGKFGSVIVPDTSVLVVESTL
jgi:hypothetical protein